MGNSMNTCVFCGMEYKQEFFIRLTASTKDGDKFPCCYNCEQYYFGLFTHILEFDNERLRYVRQCLETNRKQSSPTGSNQEANGA